MKIAVATIGGAFIAIFALVWIVQGNEFLLYRVFAPQYESVRRNTFEQSRAFNEGMQQELQRARQDYASADENGRAAIKAMVLHRVADYDLNKIQDPTLTAWIFDLRRGS